MSSYVVECGKPNQRKAGGLEAPQSSLEASKSRLEAPKSRPGGSKIEAWGFPNQPKSPPRRNFLKTSTFEGSWEPAPFVADGYNGQLGSKLEAQDLPKSRPKPEKIDVKKRHVFGIDLGRVRTSFFKGFW